MADAMVTARMTHSKKESGNAILKQLGTTASQAINDLYDYLLENRSLPFPQAKQPHVHTPDEISRAVELIDSIPTLPLNNQFATMTDIEIKTERLRARGLLD